MRYVLLALALCACHRAPTGTTPTNKAPAPDYSATANDELGFLPVGSDVVVGVNAVALRQGALWHTFEPQIRGLVNQFNQMAGDCAQPNAIDTLERVTAALTMAPDKMMHGVIVVRGIDTSRMLDCTVKQSKAQGANATLDRGVVVVTYPNKAIQMAVAVVGPSTMVMQLETAVSYDSMQKVLASGTPLRSSATFLRLYERREPNASLWGMANGNASFFAELDREGLRPKAIDGTIVLTDKVTVNVRLAMATPGAAAKVASEVNKVKPMAGAYVETLEANSNESTAAIRVVANEAQMRQLMIMLGGAMGGP
jgi:hypothetical protein